MNKISSNYLKYYDMEIVKMINNKYNISYMDSFKKFINSKVYSMLENKELEMYEYSAIAIFDMWENEIITGTPHNSIYLRSVD